MADWELADPPAGALVESLCVFGYTPESAIADLLDNSISAEGTSHRRKPRLGSVVRRA